MNPQLDRRLGKIWDKVRQKLGVEETNKFLNLVIEINDFDELPQKYKDLVLEIEVG